MKYIFRLRKPSTLLALLALTLVGCSSQPQREQVELASLERGHAEAKSLATTENGDSRRLQLIGEALAMIGIPYRYGGSSPDNGFDCSGLVQYSLNNVGIEAPRTAAEQFSQVRTKPVDELLPGDLVFFRIDRSTNHVGIYLGGGDFIHAPRPGSLVRLENMNKDYWQRRFWGAGTYL